MNRWGVMSAWQISDCRKCSMQWSVEILIIWLVESKSRRWSTEWTYSYETPTKWQARCSPMICGEDSITDAEGHAEWLLIGNETQELKRFLTKQCNWWKTFNSTTYSLSLNLFAAVSNGSRAFSLLVMLTIPTVFVKISEWNFWVLDRFTF